MILAHGRRVFALLSIVGPALVGQPSLSSAAHAPPAAKSRLSDNPSDKAAMSRRYSVEADLRGLRGKARASFRGKCKRGAI